MSSSHKPVILHRNGIGIAIANRNVNRHVLYFTFACAVGLSGASGFAKDGEPAGPSRDQIGDQMPEIEGLDVDAIPVDESGRPLELPGVVLELARQQANDWFNAPDWVKELQNKKIGSYFAGDLNRKSKLPREALENLLRDALKLRSYYVANSSDVEFNGSSERTLTNVIENLNAKALLSPTRGENITSPLSDWTVETLVVTEDLDVIAHGGSFMKGVLGLVVGKNLRGASWRAATLVLGTAMAYLATHFSHPQIIDDITIGFFSGLLARGLGAFDAGPLAALLNAGTSWIITPTTEEIKKRTAVATAEPEQAINRFFDKHRPKTDVNQIGTKNDRPKIATLEEDGTNFADMSPEEQIANWDKVLDIWVAVTKRYGQLLRDTHHAGRGLMMMSWSDEQAATHLVETMDSKLVSMNIESEVLLDPYKTEFFRTDRQALAKFEATFDRFQQLCEQTWAAINIDAQTMADLSKKIADARDQLLKMGVTRRDMARLHAIQVEKANAVGTIVTALSLHELRYFFSAEANRNLAPEARDSQRAVRRGFHLQSYVQKYMPLVQQQIRRMRFKNADKGHKVLQERCAMSLQKRAA